LAFVELGRGRRREQRTSARFGHDVQLGRVTFDEPAGRIVEKNERLIVVILKKGTLPLVRSPPGDFVHFRPSALLPRTKAEQRMLPDRPAGIGKGSVRKGVTHDESR